MADSKKEHMRLRNRLKQRRHKARYISERDLLENQVRHLQNLLENNMTALSWRDIALALLEAENESKATLEDLQIQHREMQQTMNSALALASTLTCRSNVPSPNRPFAFLNATLAADATARRLGMDWLSQHLYHNTDLMLNYAMFPAVGNDTYTLVRDCSDGLYDVLSRIQINYNRSLEDTFSALKPRLWSILRGETLPFYSEFLDPEITASIDPDMLYRRMVNSPGESVYFVAREFRSTDRIVLVLGNFANDELHAPNKRWTPSLLWAVVERQGPNQTRVRLVMFNGPYVVNNKTLTWEEEFDQFDLFSDEKNLPNYIQTFIESAEPNIQEKMSALSLD
ncbi:hypothetical protein THRCLA_07268 [Thraustotheca clavata]|uniref:BZIP domain-containing protein n=1 Tax=Thraustotheca clavata TaxID=74557 RepID=A0A1V9ZEW4_9STRA|nr:hypothetical protein THRCLA_07268 [Thraustotheca clavata]